MQSYKGVTVCAGAAFGKVFVYERYKPKVDMETIEPEQVKNEIENFRKALLEADEEYRRLELKFSDDKNKFDILEAHREILNDEEVNRMTEDFIQKEFKNSSWALRDSYQFFIDQLSAIEDPLIKERIVDMQDICGRLQRCLEGLPDCEIMDFEEPVILAAEELLTSQAVLLESKNVIAIVTERGGFTSHTAIIAKKLGIPAIFGITNLCGLVKSGDTVFVDADRGKLFADFNKEEAKEFKAREERFRTESESAKTFLYTDCHMLDGTKIQIKVNIGSSSPADIEAVEFSDGVGLFRTEFLYMESGSLPGEERQFQIYKKILESYKGKPVVLRTLDIGGDKNLPYMKLPEEENPFLGKRALRFCLSRPDIFETQLHAALRASVYGELWIMFPMVSGVEDFEEAMAAVERVKAHMKEEEILFSENIKFGAMIEIPSAALTSDTLSLKVDFASIGTNDLCQYLTASDRTNSEISKYYEPYHPAMFRLIKYIAENFVKNNKPISICGESGGDPLFITPLIGFGMRSFSMSASSVARMKQYLSMLKLEEAKEAAEAVIDIDKAAKIKDYLQAKFNIKG